MRDWQRQETTEHLGIIGPVVSGVTLTALVYENAVGDFYFCCRVCGACGKPWHADDYAVVQAVEHLHYFDHTHYLEEAADGSAG